MKKRTKIISIVLLSLLVVGLVSAVLVPYLSKRVEADIEVTSPMKTGISLGKASWAEERYPEGSHSLDDWTTTEIPLDISVYGGETVTLYTMSENLADAEITGFEEAIVTNLDGVTCEDFESVIVRVDSIYGDLGYGEEHDLIALGEIGCRSINNTHIEVGTEGNSLWGVGETDVTKIVVTFEEAALGTYTFTYRVIPAIE